MKYLFFLIVISFFCMIGCGGVERVDPNTEDELTADWDIKDANILAKSMVHSLKNNPIAFQNPPAVIVVKKVKKRTTEHINVDDITEGVITGLLETGRFQAVACEERAGLQSEREYQGSEVYGGEGTAVEGGVIVDGETRNFAKKVGANYAMYGMLSEIEKRKGNKRDVSYKLTLKLIDIYKETIVWQQQKDIRKKESGGTIGW